MPKARGNHPKLRRTAANNHDPFTVRSATKRQQAHWRACCGEQWMGTGSMCNSAKMKKWASSYRQLPTIPDYTTRETSGVSIKGRIDDLFPATRRSGQTQAMQCCCKIPKFCLAMRLSVYTRRTCLLIAQGTRRMLATSLRSFTACAYLRFNTHVEECGLQSSRDVLAKGH